jgi:hypothetical protein
MVLNLAEMKRMSPLLLLENYYSNKDIIFVTSFNLPKWNIHPGFKIGINISEERVPIRSEGMQHADCEPDEILLQWLMMLLPTSEGRYFFANYSNLERFPFRRNKTAERRLNTNHQLFSFSSAPKTKSTSPNLPKYVQSTLK